MLRDCLPIKEREYVKGSPSTLRARPTPSLERGHGPQNLGNFSLAACQLHLFYLGFRQLECFLKGKILLHCKQNGIQAPEPWMGPRISHAQSLGCVFHPGSILPPRPGDRLAPCTHSRRLCYLPDEGENDGRTAAGKPAPREHKAQASA